jgi:hypothetical protein
MMTAKKLITALVVLAAALPVLAQTDFAKRVQCEVQDASGTALPRLTFQQGTTPLLDFYVTRRGRVVTHDATVEAVFTFGPTATGTYYSATTNYTATNGSWFVQCPTIGTNSAAVANGLWWYTVYFNRGGQRFWTGNGELVIEATTSNEDGLNWQPITSSGAVTAHNTNGAAHADIRALIGAAVTNEVDPIATPIATNALAIAQGAVQTEADPIWAAVSNTVTTGAAAGATALQAEADPVWGASSNAVRAHTESAHAVTEDGGFRAGTLASSTFGAAVGVSASSVAGGAAGSQAINTDGFSGGFQAICTLDGKFESPAIDAIQLGTGGNSNEYSFQVYSYPMMASDGVIPVARIPYALTNINVNGRAGTVDGGVATVNLYTNGTTHGDGVLGGTNGVWFTKGTTNFWLLFN